jgi:hypothetical protein
MAGKVVRACKVGRVGHGEAAVVMEYLNALHQYRNTVRLLGVGAGRTPRRCAQGNQWKSAYEGVEPKKKGPAERW